MIQCNRLLAQTLQASWQYDWQAVGKPEACLELVLVFSDFANYVDSLSVADLLALFLWVLSCVKYEYVCPSVKTKILDSVGVVYGWENKLMVQMNQKDEL